MKHLNYCWKLLLMFVILINVPLKVTAEEVNKELLNQITYNQETKILSGKTVPNANISLADLVATVVADEKGDFQIPIPDNLEKTTVRVMDFINDTSIEVIYNFSIGKLEDERDASHSQSPLSESTQEMVGTQPTTTASPTSKTEQKITIFVWWLLLVFMVIVTVGLLFFFNYHQSRNETNLIKKQTSKRRKRKKRRR